MEPQQPKQEDDWGIEENEGISFMHDIIPTIPILAIVVMFIIFIIKSSK